MSRAIRSNRSPSVVAPTTQTWLEITRCMSDTEGSTVGWGEVSVCLCTSGVLFVVCDDLCNNAACVSLCACFRLEKMKPFSDRGVTWLECKSGCGCLLFSIWPHPDCLPEGLKAVWADIGWLCLPCVGADVSEAILFVYDFTALSAAKYFCDIGSRSVSWLDLKVEL